MCLECISNISIFREAMLYLSQETQLNYYLKQLNHFMDKGIEIPDRLKTAQANKDIRAKSLDVPEDAIILRENVHYEIMSIHMLTRILTNIYVNEDNMPILK
jgi:hypothetical protein